MVKLRHIPLKVIGPLFFDRRYLTGRHFEGGHGWRWLWRSLVWQTLFGFNRHVPWPVSPFVCIHDPAGIIFHPDDINNFQSAGTQFVNPGGRITIGRGTYIGPNVALVTTGHDPLDLDRNLPPEDIMLGDHCWVGANAVVLPGVTLGEHTVVGAGAVVTHSFPDGYCVLGGVPATVLRKLPPGRVAATGFDVRARSLLCMSGVVDSDLAVSSSEA